MRKWCGQWLPEQPWYAGTGARPQLTRVGGFRLDDPKGEVGLEFMAVADSSGDQEITYHLPLSYRGTPLDGGDRALIGTSGHGVLGKRWIYDASDGPEHTDLRVKAGETAAATDLIIRVNRVLEPGDSADALGNVTGPAADLQGADGSR